MREALELARRGLGRTAPNPPVGCLLVRGSRVVGRGFHAKAGAAHAERIALDEAGAEARAATAYVTLEPCAHHGRTPPCADALIAAGVRQAVIAALDPDPRVAGRGARRLHRAGIEVITGMLEELAVAQQSGFRNLVVNGRPWVIWKYAMSLDGRIETPGGVERWVSGSAALRLVHRWRDEADAIAVGSGTVLADDPRLTTRGVAGGRDARPVLFDRRGRIPPTAQALRPETILVTAADSNVREAERAGATVVRAEGLAEALAELGRLGVSSLLLEGGATLAGAFYRAGLMDEVRTFVAPKLFGSGLGALATAPASPDSPQSELRDTVIEAVGNDALIRGYLKRIPRFESSESSAAALS